MAENSFSVAKIIGLIEADRFDEFCFEGSDDEVSDL